MKKNIFKNVEWGILICTILLTLIGTVALFSATQNTEYDEFKKQIMWIFISIPFLIMAIVIDYESIAKVSPVFYGVFLILLIAVLFTESVNEEVLLSMKNPDADQVSSTLKELDLDAFSERHPMSLSGGQKQRVAIASALASDREILVFDEPTSGLDLLHMSEVAKQLETLRRMQKTSIVITHDYELIVSCCTHILHLEHGEVQAQYPLDEAGADRLKKFFIEME